MKNWRLKHRILLIALAPVWIISLLLILLVVVGGITEIDGALKARGAMLSRQLAPASEYGAFSGNREVLQALSLAVMREDDARAVTITDAEQRVLVTSGTPSPLGKEHAMAAQRAQILKGEHGNLIFGTAIYQGKSEGDDFDLLALESHRQSAAPKLLGYVFLELGTSTSERSKNIFILLSILIGLLGTAGASVLALRMSRTITRPLSALLQGVNQMAQGKLETRLVAHSGGELAELENGFNLMASKLQGGRDAILAVNANLENLVAARTEELEQRNLELERLSIMDGMTGLYNRLKMEAILELEYARSVRYGTSFAIALMDIDKFKLVNDTFGHACGDQVLIGIAKILSENTRSMDAVGRWGGEEFLLIVHEATLQAAITMAEKLCGEIQLHPFDNIGNRTASFGVTAYRQGDNIDDMMARADRALYRAKNKGRNRVEFDE